MDLRATLAVATCVALAACGVGADSGRQEGGPSGRDASSAERPAETSTADPVQGSGEGAATARASRPAGPVIPAGTTLDVELDHDVGPSDSRVGDAVRGHVDDPVLTESHELGIPEGTTVRGEVTGLYAGDGERPAAVRLDLRTLVLGEKSYDLPVEILEAHVGLGDRLGQIGGEGEAGGAVADATAGTLLGDDVEAAVGEALGAGAGSAISLGHGAGAELPEGSNLEVRLTRDLILER